MAYLYEPLQPATSHVRLLRLQPAGSSKDGLFRKVKTNTSSTSVSNAIASTISTKIECCMFTADLDSTPLHEFNALSYTWGPPQPTRVININNQCFRVRENLWQFLCVAVQDPDICSLPIWIDQICIDQSWTQERNHQVGLMSKVYKRASGVLIWLGSSTIDSEFVLKAIASDYVLEEIKDAKIPEISTWRTMGSELLSRSYWSRLWIVQEVLLATTPIVMCGSRKVHWDRFQFYMHTMWPSINRSVVQSPNGIAAALHLIGLRRSNQTKELITLDSLITETRHCECANKRDKVFGLLALLPDEQRVEVNYDVSLQGLVYQTLAVIISHYKFLGHEPRTNELHQTILQSIMSSTKHQISNDVTAQTWFEDLDCSKLSVEVSKPLREVRYPWNIIDDDDDDDDVKFKVFEDIWPWLKHGKNIGNWWIRCKEMWRKADWRRDPDLWQDAVFDEEDLDFENFGTQTGAVTVRFENWFGPVELSVTITIPPLETRVRPLRAWFCIKSLCTAKKTPENILL